MDELDVYRRQGLGHTTGIGSVPALLIVDFVNGFVDAEHFGGGNIPAAVRNTQPVLRFARRSRWPIVFTRLVYADDGSDAGAFARKIPTLLKLRESNHLSQLVSMLAPAEGELVLRKQQPSAFFETGLSSWLRWREVDTVIVAGCTTSGCVRASVVDSVSHNFRTIVLSDCVGDRALPPHEANLFDMEQKYADVATGDELINRIATSVRRP